MRVGVGRRSAPTRPASSQRFALPLWLPSPWIAPSFGRTDHSPLRTDRDRFRINQLSSGLFRELRMRVRAATAFRISRTSQLLTLQPPVPLPPVHSSPVPPGEA